MCHPFPPCKTLIVFIFSASSIESGTAITCTADVGVPYQVTTEGTAAVKKCVGV